MRPYGLTYPKHAYKCSKCSCIGLLLQSALDHPKFVVGRHMFSDCSGASLLPPITCHLPVHVIKVGTASEATGPSVLIAHHVRSSKA